MTSANQIKFGVEVETYVNRNALAVGGYYSNGAAVDYLPQGWGAKRDGSLTAHAPAGKMGCEFVSPVLEGEAGLLEAYNAVKEINARGARVNRACGVHVTITFPADNAAALSRLILLVAHYEKGLFATTGTKYREGSQWCKKITRHGDGEKTSAKKADKAKKAAQVDRYHALNLTHMAAGKNRVEFRLFSGSTNADKIIAWVRLVLAIAEYALNTDRAVSFENKSKSTSSSLKRFGGEGSSSLGMLLCRLGWLRWKRWGYDGTTYGNVVSEALPTMESSLDVLRKLAKKYDEQD